MSLKLITAAAAEPITLAEAKAHLRVVDNDEDLVIALLIKAARDAAETFTGRALVTQTWDLYLDAFPAATAEIKIPLPPLQSVVSVKYDDAAGVEQTLGTGLYTVANVNDVGWVLPKSTGWPQTIDAVNAVRIRFISGYAPDANSPPDLAANIPPSIKAAMLLIIGALYENKESVTQGVVMALPFGASSEHLLRPYRVLLGMA
jgi:uncharacterized phiE125 gp8 family phage protein